MKILENLGDGIFKVQFEDRQEKHSHTKVRVAHDYINFTKQVGLTITEKNSSGLDDVGWYIINKDNTKVYTDNKYITVELSIGSRLLKWLVEHLSKHSYTQDKHFEEGNYIYQKGSIKFYEDGVPKYSVLIEGEESPIVVGEAFYNKLVEKEVI